LNKLVEFRQKNGTVHGFPDAEKYRSRRVASPPSAKFLIPAATENVITSRNVDRVKCRILAEGGQRPTTSAADDVLTDKGVFVIPDILANAGGVTTSYFEWVQDRQGYFWKESRWVNEQLEEIMVSVLRRRGPLRRTHKVNNRIGRLYACHRSRRLHHPPSAEFTPRFLGGAALQRCGREIISDRL